MTGFKLSFVKDYEGVGEPHKDNYLQHGNRFIGVEWFESGNFHNLDKKNKKKVVKKILNNKKRSDFKQERNFDKKERVIVNEQGYYGLDKTLYDETIKIPDHLVDKND